MLSVLAERAKSLGFLAVGITRSGRPSYLDQFFVWLAQGRHGEMSWMERNREAREDPSCLLKGCKTIISLAHPYPLYKPRTADGFCVSRYANPAAEDYHVSLKKKMQGTDPGPGRDNRRVQGEDLCGFRPYPREELRPQGRTGLLREK